MAITFTCPHCKIRVRIEHAGPGQTVFCTSCAREIRLKAPSPPAASAPPRAAQPPPEFDRTMMGNQAPANRPAPAPVGNYNRTVLASEGPVAPPPGNYDRTVIVGQAPTRPPISSGEDGTMMAHQAPHSRSGPPPMPRRKKRSVVANPLLWAGSCLALIAVVGGGYFFFRAGPAKPKMTQGVIEVGSTGVKALGVHFFSTSSGYDWETKFKGDRNVNMGTLTDDRKFRPEALEELKGALREFVEKMKKEADLPDGDIRIVSSSGVFSGFVSDDERRSAQKVLGDAVRSAVSKDIDFITVQDESRYGLLASIRPEDRKDFVLVDIGGGNTKGGYFDDQNQFHPMTDCPGVKKYTTLLKKVQKETGTPFATAAGAKREESIGTPLKNAITLKPGLDSRKKVLLIGGIVWALANMVHPDNREVRVNLSASDIQSFSVLVRSTSDPESLRTAIFSKMTVTDAKVRDEVEKELKKIQETFTPEQFVAGSEILLSLSKELRLGAKQVVFFRKGHLAWPMGYLLEKGKIVP